MRKVWKPEILPDEILKIFATLKIETKYFNQHCIVHSKLSLQFYFFFSTDCIILKRLQINLFFPPFILSSMQHSAVSAFISCEPTLSFQTNSYDHDQNKGDHCYDDDNENSLIQTKDLVFWVNWKRILSFESIENLYFKRPKPCFPKDEKTLFPAKQAASFFSFLAS